MEYVRKQLDDFRKLAVKIIHEACLESLLEAGYTIDDSNITLSQTAYGKLGKISSKVRIPGINSILKMSFIEQAKKREKCRRLSR